MPQETEQRELTRSKVTLDADLGNERAHVVSTKTRDISLKGLYVYCDTTLPAGSRVDIRLRLEGPDGLVIRAWGHVARVDARGMGIQIQEIADTESFTHLQNLALMNADEADVVEREIEAYLSTHPLPDA